MTTHLRQQLIIAAGIFSAWLALVGGQAIFAYITASPDHYDPVFRHKYVSEHVVVLLHGMAGVVALLFGPAQFWGGLRQRLPVLHRAMGVVYLAAVVVAATTGVPMGVRAFGGTLARAGFCGMSAAWLLTAWLAFATARQRKFIAHRQWMMRNYALTFGAVQLRIYLFALQSAGLTFTTVYPYVSWLAWLPNLLAVEWFLRSEKRGERK